MANVKSAKRRKVAHDAPKAKKPVAKEVPAEPAPESEDEESEEESATLEEPSAEETPDAPKKTFKDLVGQIWLFA
jgi:ATP-dependent RNA helicase DDX47/RRP3